MCQPTAIISPDGNIVSTPLSIGNTVSGSASSTKNSARGERRRRVSFSSLEIWEISVRLGDHPCCKRGAALELSDDIASIRRVSLEDYETSRAPRRTRREMKIPRRTREAVLLRCGYSMEEIYYSVNCVGVNASYGQRQIFDFSHDLPLGFAVEGGIDSMDWACSSDWNMEPLKLEDVRLQEMLLAS